MLQTVLTALIVLAAAAYLARYIWRASQSKASGCGCANPQCETTKQPH